MFGPGALEDFQELLGSPGVGLRVLPAEAISRVTKRR
jgi:hypothetical protein